MICNKHLPALCIAMEYLRVNNLALALKFATNARQMCADDPLVFNETGVAHYKNGDFAEARSCFERALALLGPEARRRGEWEPAFFNLAHAHRKLHNYADALRSKQCFVFFFVLFVEGFVIAAVSMCV